MGWKNFKEHYKVDFMEVSDGEIHVGVSYVPSMFSVDMKTGAVQQRSSLLSDSALRPLYERLKNEQAHLVSVLTRPDSFGDTYPVYTYTKNGEVVERRCEAYGWPNVTTDGELMYENMFFRTRNAALNECISSLSCSLNFLDVAIEEQEKRLQELRERAARTKVALEAAQAQLPLDSAGNE